MTGLLTLSNTILCKKEVLGKTYECEIDGIKAQIHFPQYPVIDESNPIIGISNPLLPPEIGASWKRGEEPLSWGYPMNYPEGNSCVELLALSIECKKENVNENASKLYETIQTWEYAFIDYLKLETKQGIDRDKNIRRNSCILELMEDKYLPNNRPITLSLTIPTDDSFASETNIINAISFANSGKELMIEYQMLLSAYEARRTNQNRRAILDACAAMEITLLDQINQYCHSIGLSPEILTKKYRYLGERIDLLKKIGGSIPNSDYKALVVDPRNAVMHNRDVYPSDETTEKLISCVEGFLNHFHDAYY